MNEEALLEWIKDRLDEGEDATVYEFAKELLDRSNERSSMLDSANAKIEELTNANGGFEKEIARLKAHNYDLLMKTADDQGGGDGKVVENIEEDGEIIHIDNLFEDGEKKEDN